MSGRSLSDVVTDVIGVLLDLKRNLEETHAENRRLHEEIERLRPPVGESND